MKEIMQNKCNKILIYIYIYNIILKPSGINTRASTINKDTNKVLTEYTNTNIYKYNIETILVHKRVERNTLNSRSSPCVSKP